MASIIKADVWQNSAGVAYGTVLQVKQVIKTDYFSTSSTSWVDWTGMSVTITPTSSSSKILVSMSSCASNDTVNSFQYIKLQRNGVDIALGDARGNATRCWVPAAQQMAGTTPVWALPIHAQYLDSPSTTSIITYKLQVIRTANGIAWFGSTANVDDGNRSASPSTLTVMEIAA